MATSITENLRSYTRLQPDFLRGAALMACLLSLSGCALKPFARIDGSGGSVALREHADVTIVAVGDRWFLDGLTTWDVPPGTHEITFVSAFRPELRVPPTLQASNANPGPQLLDYRQTIEFDFQPCVHYLFHALHPDVNDLRVWTVGVTATRAIRIGGCAVPETDDDIAY